MYFTKNYTPSCYTKNKTRQNHEEQTSYLIVTPWKLSFLLGIRKDNFNWNFSLALGSKKNDTINIRIGKEDMKLSLVIDDMIAYLKSPQIYTIRV